MPDLVPVTYREPFAFGQMPWRDQRPHGETILEIVRSVPNLPAGFLDRGGVVCINGEVVPRRLWHLIRPKPTSEYLPITVTLHWPLQSGGGGKSGGVKSIIAIVAAIALVVVTAGIATGALIPAGLAGAVGNLGFLGITGAQVLAGAVGIAGSLAISMLTQPPTTNTPTASTDVNTDNREPAGATGNIIAKGGAIPRILGTRKVFPPLIAEPEVEYINENGDERVSAIFALNGPHAISDMRLDGNSISGMADVETEIRQGLSGDAAPSLVTRQARTVAPQITLTQHVLQSDNVTITSSSTGLPKWHRVTSFTSPDQITVQFVLPGGLTLNGTNSQALPIRMRCRLAGAANWINLPEMHLQNNATKQMKVQVVLLWGATWPGWNLVATNNGFIYAHRAPPAQSISPATPTAWVADSQFDAGAGNDYVFSGNEGSTRIKNLQMFSYSANFFMDPLPRGRYEIEVMHGSSYNPGSFNKTSYFYNNGFSTQIYDFFWYWTSAGQPAITSNQTNVVATMVLIRCVSIWFQNPFQGSVGKFSAIQIRAVNRNIQNLSVVASGIVGTWNGANWTSITGPSSNPAAHFRDVLLGSQNHDPLDSTLTDDAGLASWYGYCNTNGWTCDTIIDDMRTQDVLSLLASCGYARPYQSDFYGVTVDRDRTADAPVQVFSRANTSNMKFEKGFARVPAGLIVSYKDSMQDFGDQQLVVNQSNPAVGTTGLYESISYDGLIDDDRSATRARFDLDQANLRSTFYSFETDVESIVCRRGDLVAIQHDVLTLRAGDARIKTVLTGGGSPDVITGFILNSIIPCASGTGIALRRTDGTITTHAITNTTDTDTITLATPIATSATIIGYDDSNKEYGCLIVSGDIATVYKRMLVFTIAPTSDLQATVTVVDESPSLIRFPPTKTILLAHMDGANGGVVFSDATARHSLAPLGSAHTDTTVFKFSTASMATGGGSNQGLSTGDDPDWHFGGMDFTIDLQLRLNTNTVQQVFWSQGFDSNNWIAMAVTSTAGLLFQESVNGSLTANFASPTSLLGTAAFAHIAFERYGNLFNMYINGNSVASTTSPIVFQTNRGAMTIGCFRDFTQSVNGYIDEFRISRVARYKGANFTPPAAAYTVD